MKRRVYSIRSMIWEAPLAEGFDTQSSASLTVFEPESEQKKTGLLDKHGNEIWAGDQRERIGFLHGAK